MADENKKIIDDHQQQQERNNIEDNCKGDHHGTGTKFNCSFCKRGFTNPQALGGHMNLHRKDKQVLQQQVSKTSSTKLIKANKVSEPYMGSISAPNNNSMIMMTAIVSANPFQYSNDFFSDRHLAPCTDYHSSHSGADNNSDPHQFRANDHRNHDDHKSEGGDDEEAEADLDLELRLGRKL